MVRIKVLCYLGTDAGWQADQYPAFQHNQQTSTAPELTRADSELHRSANGQVQAFNSSALLTTLECVISQIDEYCIFIYVSPVKCRKA